MFLMAEIPEKKRDDDDLARLRMHNAMQMRPPNAAYQKKLASRVLLGVGYFLSLFGLGLVVGPLIFSTKPLSKHHGAFMGMISFLVLLGAAMIYREDIAFYLESE